MVIVVNIPKPLSSVQCAKSGAVWLARGVDGLGVQGSHRAVLVAVVVALLVNALLVNERVNEMIQ